MPPIRVGLVGLGPKGTAGFVPGLWSTMSHLPSIQALPGYELVAVANSTADSARKSIAAHDLPASVKPYGSAEDLANDPDVELVVVSVHVDKHFRLAKPAILAKKDVFVEWPLGASLDESEELTRLAAASGVKTAVGVQGHSSKLSLKLAELVASGKIGRVLSTSVSSSSRPMAKKGWLQGAEYVLDMNSGGNEVNILFGHFLHSFVNVLDDFSEVQVLLKTHYNEVPILGPTGEVVDPAFKKTTPDDILVQGTLESGATASISSFKSETPVASDRSFLWRITGTEGEIELTSPEFGWQIGHPEAKITIRDSKGGEPRQVELEALDPGIGNLGQAGQNIALIYEAFAQGDTGRYATFERATQTHRLVKRIIEASGFRA